MCALLWAQPIDFTILFLLNSSQEYGMNILQLICKQSGSVGMVIAWPSPEPCLVFLLESWQRTHQSNRAHISDCVIYKRERSWCKIWLKKKSKTKHGCWLLLASLFHQRRHLLLGCQNSSVVASWWIVDSIIGACCFSVQWNEEEGKPESDFFSRILAECWRRIPVPVPSAASKSLQ